MKPGRTRFYAAMSVALLVTVFLGFAPTYYLKAGFGTPELSLRLHVHGALLTAWYVLLVVQTTLVSAGRADIHRVLGVLGVGLAVLIVPVTAWVQPHTLWLTVGFLALVLTATYFRRQPEIHRRLMLLASISFVGAGFARLVRHLFTPAAGGGPPPWPIQVLFGFGLSIVLWFLVALAIHDLVTRRRLHPATLWGGLFVLAVRHMHGDFPTFPMMFDALARH